MWSFVKKRAIVPVLLLLMAAAGRAQEMAVPVQTQLPLFLKILTFDRNLRARAGHEIVIGVVYQNKFRASLNAKDELMRAVSASQIKNIEGIPVYFVPIDVSVEADLIGDIVENHVDVLYVTPVRALGMETFTAVSRERGIVTLTGVLDYVASGLSVGVEVKGGKPHIVINLRSAKAEGADFSSQLLKLVKMTP